MCVVIAPAATAQGRYAAVADSIIAAWKHADVVCLGESHGRYFDNELRIAVVRHPEFPRVARVVVVEMANPVQQPLLDRFILDGEPLSREQLAPVWRDATNPEVWEIPIYEEFLRAIRDVNLRLPREQRVRVLGGDSKVDWSRISRPEELIPFMNRGGNIRNLIAEQVLDPGLKALAIYGGGHCLKIGMGFPGDLAGRYPLSRFWAIYPLHSRAEMAKARAMFGLTDKPAYVVLNNSPWASQSSEGLLDPRFSRFPLGRLYDALIYHGDVPDSVVAPDMVAFRASFGAEFDRRRRILAEAIQLRQQRP
jgi:hypothetical protein